MKLQNVQQVLSSPSIPFPVTLSTFSHTHTHTHTPFSFFFSLSFTHSRVFSFFFPAAEKQKKKTVGAVAPPLLVPRHCPPCFVLSVLHPANPRTRLTRQCRSRHTGGRKSGRPYRLSTKAGAPGPWPPPHASNTTVPSTAGPWASSDQRL
jgi:hypothetical protein